MKNAEFTGSHCNAHHAEPVLREQGANEQGTRTKLATERRRAGKPHV
jgi:hypothetical protein